MRNIWDKIFEHEEEEFFLKKLWNHLGKYKKIIGDTEPVLGNLILLEENDPLHRTI